MDPRRLRERWSPLRALRLLVLLACVLTLLSAGHSFLSYDPVTRASAATPANATSTGTTATAAGRPDAPVVVATVDGVGPGQLVAYDANGDVVYRDDSLFLYHDVDPSPVGTYTVTYVASETADSGACPGESCLRNVIERANLTTGEVTRLYSWVDTRNGSAQVHDVDRVNATTFLVADINFPDRVYMVNTTTGEVTWEWRVSEAYDPESGGSYPRDWTHLNDVEYLPDGRVMADLRNQDQVVFIRPGEGIQPNWTLGADDDHRILYEQHNPDYIPASRGGPAVVVADSENNRIVEYQRTNGSWERTWRWRDTRLQWPRDADRLPSGRTLVVDSHGQRILSVAPSGRIVWSRTVPTGVYDAELLGTGAESAGGESAAALGLRSRRPGAPIEDGATSMRNATVGPSRFADASTTGEANATAAGATATGATATGSTGSAGGPGLFLSTIGYRVVSLVPPLVLHGLLYTLPTWATPIDAVLVLVTALVGGAWLVVEVGVRVAPWIRARRE